MTPLFALAAALFFASTAADSVAVGVSRFVAIDSAHTDTIRGVIWYPSAGTPRQTALGLQDLQVVVDGPYLAGGERRPLVIVSHGTGGNELGHWDTAEALVRAGFVVATVRHAGDNSADASALGTDRFLYGRPRQIAVALDRILGDSVWGTRVDSARVGLLGFSAGGYTGLLVVGAHPTTGLLSAYCVRHPTDATYCSAGLEGAFRLSEGYARPAPDSRVRSAALLAPAMGFLFDSAGLANVHRPIMLVRAERDRVVREPDNVLHLSELLPQHPKVRMMPGAGHYTFLAPCGARLARVAPDVCTDEPGVIRTETHAVLYAALIHFFQETLRATR